MSCQPVLKPSPYLQTAIVYYDLETTGLNTNNADTIELAAKIDPECKQLYQEYFQSSKDWVSLPIVADSFCSLVYPDSGEIPAAASKCNGIYMQDVQGKPKFSEVAKQFVEWLSEWRKWCPPSCTRILIVAHNNFDYDSKILLRQCKKHGVKLPEFVEFGDSLVAFRECFPYPQRKFNMQNLNSIWVPKEKQLVQDHRALSDVEMLILVVRSCPDCKEFVEKLIERKRAIA